MDTLFFVKIDIIYSHKNDVYFPCKMPLTWKALGQYQLDIIKVHHHGPCRRQKINQNGPTLVYISRLNYPWDLCAALVTHNS